MTFHHVHRYAQDATCVAFFNVCQMHKSLVLCAAITAVHLLRYSDMCLERSTIASHPQSRKVLATSGHVYMCKDHAVHCPSKRPVALDPIHSTLRIPA